MTRLTRARVASAIAGLIVCIGLIAEAQAAKMPMVDICHWDVGAKAYRKLQVSENALEGHLTNHGDVMAPHDEGDLSLDENCEVREAGVLARAFIDVNPNDMDGYNPVLDIDIAVLWDTNSDHVPSIGDTLILNQFPTTFDPCPGPQLGPLANCSYIGNIGSVGTAEPGSFPITGMGIFSVANGSGFMEMFIADGINVEFAKTATVERFYVNTVVGRDDFGWLWLIDAFDPVDQDWSDRINWRLGTAEPRIELILDEPEDLGPLDSFVDNYFLDVELYF